MIYEYTAITQDGGSYFRHTVSTTFGEGIDVRYEISEPEPIGFETVNEIVNEWLDEQNSL